MNIKVITGRTPRNYVGMNWYAAKALGIKFKHGKNTILVDKELGSECKSSVISHEKGEIRLMKQGYSYSDAHDNAPDYCEHIKVDGKRFDI